MATVYKNVEAWAARQAKKELRAKGEELAVRSRARLKSRWSSGASRIIVERAKLDVYLVLEDPGPNGNALAIEFGRGAGAEHGASQGVYALSYAIGLARG